MTVEPIDLEWMNRIKLKTVMKSYLIKALVAAVCYLAVYLILDALFGSFRTVAEYAVQCVVFGILFGLFLYLEEKGIFKKKDPKETSDK